MIQECHIFVQADWTESRALAYGAGRLDRVNSPHLWCSVWLRHSHV